MLARLPPSTDRGIIEIRATLLGRLGQHAAALNLYVDVLHDLNHAERYCQRVYDQPEPRNQAQHDVFLTLVQTLLSSSSLPPPSEPASTPSKQRRTLSPKPSSRPTSPLPLAQRGGSSTSHHRFITLEPNEPSTPANEQRINAALTLLQRHGSKVDSTRVVPLLPPLVPLSKLKSYLTHALRRATASQASTHLARSVAGARNDQLDHALIALRDRKVRITSGSLCGRCGKKLGTSTGLAVNPVTGHVTHYFCRAEENEGWEEHHPTNLYL